MLLILIILVLFVCGDAKHFETNCDLVYELRGQGFPEDLMRDWVCLINAESHRMTNALGPTNKEGYRDHGLFHIFDKWWCSKDSSPGKACNVTCDDLRTDDITIASRCAKKIYERHGFYAWRGWRDNCQESLPDISHC